MTEDADVAIPVRLPTRTPSIHSALIGAGFRAHLSGSDQLPTTRYFPDDNDQGMYVEFIAPELASGRTRTGEPADLVAIAGVTAQKLRHVDILLFEPWELALSAQHGFDVGPVPLVVRVANPASYLAQKLLTLTRRATPKKAKDALYLHDTVAIPGSELGAVREQAARVLAHLHGNARSELQRHRVDIFRDDALLARAADIAAATGRASPPSAATIRQVCTTGLELIFAP